MERGEAAAWAAAAAWTYLTVGHGQFWRVDAAGPPGAGGLPDEPRWPAVAVVIPARNEAAVLPRTLPSVLDQDYPGPARVVLVADRSSDGTAEVAAGLAAGGSRLPLQVVAATAPPAGWAGKLWALQQGLDALGDDPPELVLFTDADIRHPPHSLRHLVAAAQHDRRDVVSLMARLRVETGWERLVIPAFVYFFGQLYPFRRVAGPGRTAAAAGGCLLVRRRALEAAGGLTALHGARIDDVAVARAVKAAGGRLWLGWADEVRSERPYPHLGDLWQMVARSAFDQLRYSTPLLAGTLAGLVGMYLWPPLATLAGVTRRDRRLALAGAAGWSLMTATYVPTVRYHRLPARWAATLPAAAALYGAMTFDSARRHWAGEALRWREPAA